eukprot:gene34217-56948_t
MLDNMLAAHARDPYEGPRKIVVAMGAMRSTRGERGKAGRRAGGMSVMTDPVETSFPLSPEHRMVPAGAERQLLLVGIEGMLDTARLRIAVEGVLQSHGALCAAIRQVPGYRGPRLQPLDGMPPPKWQSADVAEAELAAWLEAFHREPLAAERGELVSVGLVRTADARHTLALSVNALAADRESLQNLFDQIAAVYLDEGSVESEDIFQY